MTGIQLEDPRETYTFPGDRTDGAECHACVVDTAASNGGACRQTTLQRSIRCYAADDLMRRNDVRENGERNPGGIEERGNDLVLAQVICTKTGGI